MGDNKKVVPIILDYNFHDLFGRAEVQADGTAILTFTDQRIIDLFRKGQRGHLVGVSINVRPVLEKPEYAHYISSMKDPEQARRFREAAIALDRPVVAYCGTVFKPRQNPPEEICPECIEENKRMQFGS